MHDRSQNDATPADGDATGRGVGGHGTVAPAADTPEVGSRVNCQSTDEEQQRRLIGAARQMIRRRGWTAESSSIGV